MKTHIQNLLLALILFSGQILWATPPTISTPVKSGDGHLQFTLGGSQNQYYTILYSTNLSDWFPLLTTNLINGASMNLVMPFTNRVGYYRAYESGIVVSQSIFSFGAGTASVPVFYVNVTNGVAIIPITRTNGLATNVCVHYSTSDGTAIGNLGDYTPQSGTLCFAPNVTSNSIFIPIFLDNSTNQPDTVNLHLSNTNGTTVLDALLVINRPKPILAVSPTSMTNIVPDNCGQFVIISNAGPQGSLLNYTLVDDGALGGFLNFNRSGPVGYATGALQAGQSASVYINVLYQFATNWFGGNLTTTPTIYTPAAANYVKFPLSVTITDNHASAQNLIRTWGGSWHGYKAPNNLPVSGTWAVTIQGFGLTYSDYSGGAMSGTLTWQGNDYYTNDITGGMTSYTISLMDVPIRLNNPCYSCTDGSGTASYSIDGCSGICTLSFGDFYAPLAIDPVTGYLIGGSLPYDLGFTIYVNPYTHQLSSPGHFYFQSSLGEPLSTGAVTSP